MCDSRGACHGGGVGLIYEDLTFPPPPDNRPYVAINMVTTIDGKTISGERNEGVMDLGSPTDHKAMRNIEKACDAVMIGAGTLRATQRITYAPRLYRFVVARSPNLDWNSGFFTEAPDRSFVVTTKDSAQLFEHHPHLAFGNRQVDFEKFFRHARSMLEIDRIVVEGGSELNASLLSADLIDEIFITLAPKVKLGRESPTLAGGIPLARANLLQFTLISNHAIDSEVFLRYRRADASNREFVD